MILESVRVFNVLLYKNFLIRKRQWAKILFIEILLPLLLVFAAWSIRNVSALPPRPVEDTRIFPLENKHSHLPRKQTRLFVVPRTKFTTFYMGKVHKCLEGSKIGLTIKAFDSEKTMLRQTNYFGTMAVVFKNESIDFSSKKFDYKIRVWYNLPSKLYSDKLESQTEAFKYGLVGLQMCLDETFIKMKKKNQPLKVEIVTQMLPIPPYIDPDDIKEAGSQFFSGFAVIIFLIPLCMETSNVFDEKVLGISILMAMNGVTNCMNLFSWLVTGLIFSLSYTIPIVILLNFSSVEYALPYLYYGNSFLFWFVLTVHVGHLLTFGMHLSTYFARSGFLMIGIVIIYILGAIVMEIIRNQRIGFDVVSCLGIFFPNILLYKACEEFNYFENIGRGMHFSNMFKVGNAAYNNQGSIGIILILSIVGSLFHFVMANYTNAIRPGKYGIKKSPLYFLNCYKSLKTEQNTTEIENLECTTSNRELFEPITDNVFSPGIQIRNLKKSYNIGWFGKQKIHALNGISVDFYHKQITALLGHNGAGKTTLMSIITGMISPTEGVVLINGKNIKDKMDEIMSDMGLCPQEDMVFPSLSVAEHLTIFGMLKNRNKPDSIVEGQVTAYMEKFKLFEKRNSLPKELSGAQVRLLCLGMALVGDPNTIILDEPTSGLDPENRRIVWNILMKMRREKTIIICTHDMEEADVLSDRIAIVHSGTLRSYGTSMFLKKSIGQGNLEVTLSTESWSDPEKIQSELGTQSELVKADGSSIQLRMPNTAELPDFLDKLESNKSELGITGISVSLITLEQVFLRVAHDNEVNTQTREVFTNTKKKLEGLDLFFNAVKGLLYKKMTYSIKNSSIFFVMLGLLALGMFCFASIFVDHSSEETDIVPINLDMYHEANFFYRTDSKSAKFGANYKAVAEEYGGIAVEDQYTNQSVVNALLMQGKEDFASYSYRLIAAGEFIRIGRNTVRARAMYNSMQATYALPISLNLITNALLKTLIDASHSISVEVQEFPRNIDAFDITEKSRRRETLEAVMASTIFVLFFYSLVSLFVIHPRRESSTNIKHLQTITGASGFGYWGAMFVFDFMVMSILMVLIVIGFEIIDVALELRMFKAPAILILILLLFLFTINVLPMMYVITFFNTTTNGVIKLLTLLPFELVILDLLMGYFNSMFKSIFTTLTDQRPTQQVICMLTPYVSFYQGLVALLKIARNYGNCEKLSTRTKKPLLFVCTDYQCFNGTCEKYPDYFINVTEDFSLKTSVQYLCFTPILYFGLLYILERKLLRRWREKIRDHKQENIDETFEAQVKKEKHSIAFEVSKIKSREQDPNFEERANEETEGTSNNTAESQPNNDEAKINMFMAYELKKIFIRCTAVQDVSFGVCKGECFGLLGVNGAGKSTTFKMITGDVIPSRGLMYLNKTEISNNRQLYFSQMGYCPQNHAIIKSLNSYDHLRLFARLRGIPEREVENEVKKWIDRLNLNACASQPSGTYSGGNKRRLNIAMAMIGLPNLVLLDEPTTGVDPAARRALWHVIQSCQASGQAVILTSHSMEECEALCNRLAIMVDGKFECIGASQELKQRFGAGYNVQLKLNAETPADELNLIKEYMNDAFDCTIMDENSECLMYHLTSSNLTWRRMYDIVIELKSRYPCIEDFTILSSTLEQLFLTFAKSANKSESKNEESF